LSDGKRRRRMSTIIGVTDDAAKLVQATMLEIDDAKFVGKGDKTKVKQMLAELNWIMKTAMEQVELAQSTRRGSTTGRSVQRVELSCGRDVLCNALYSMRSQTLVGVGARFEASAQKFRLHHAHCVLPPCCIKACNLPNLGAEARRGARTAGDTALGATRTRRAASFEGRPLNCSARPARH
jgi:hypothetical protein